MIENYENLVCCMAIDLDDSGLSLEALGATDALFNSMNSVEEDTDPNVDNLFGGEQEHKEDKTTDGGENPDPEDIFGSGTKKETNQEKVSSEVDKDDLSGQGEGTEADLADGNSPYQSFLTAMKGDGILPDIDDESIKDVQTAEDFAEILEKQMDIRLESKLDAATKRVYEALNSGVEVEEVQKFERTLTYLESINEDAIEGEGEAAESLRRQLIKQDFLNRGFSNQRAEREVEKSFNAATDIEDAKEALTNNREYFREEYTGLINEAKEEAKQFQAKQQEMYKNFQKKVLDTEEPFSGLKLDKHTRQLVIENLTKPIHKDESGNVLTAFQKFQRENPIDAQYYVGLLFTITDGFKNLEKLVKPTLKKERRENIRALESKLKSNRGFQDSGNSIFEPQADPEDRITLDI